MAYAHLTKEKVRIWQGDARDNYGTAAGLIKRNGKPYLLTAAHVISWPATKQTVSLGGVGDEAIGREAVRVPADPGAGNRITRKVDAAVARIWKAHRASVLAVFENRFLEKGGRPGLGHKVQMLGGFSGHCTDTVHDPDFQKIEIELPINAPAGQGRTISIASTILTKTAFGAEGDSGAAAFDSHNKFIGLFIGIYTHAGGSHGVIVPAEPIFSQLTIDS